MNVSLDIKRSLLIPVPVAQALPLLDDLEALLGRFPKLRRLTPLGAQRYRWEMETIGSRMAKIAHNVVYGAEYEVDRAAGCLRWKPLEGEGNARLAGSFSIISKGAAATELCIEVAGELREIPVPLMYRLVAPPFIQGKFTSLADRFLAETGAALQP